MPVSSSMKYVIAEGTKELLQTIPFAELSVGSITKQCHISRNTFYYHFQDKYDVISWIFHTEIALVMGDTLDPENWSDKLLLLCRYMQKNKKFYINVLKFQGQNSFTECLLDFYETLVRKMILNIEADKVLSLSQEQIGLISRFYAYGLTGSFMDWAKDGMEEDPEPTIRMMEQLTSGKIVSEIMSLQSRKQE